MSIFKKKQQQPKVITLQKTYVLPDGAVNPLCADMLDQPHLLIAGATGSGKSVLINSLMWTALHKTPGRNSFVLIDPKRVELRHYAVLPHCIAYASEPDDIVSTLQAVVFHMDERYREMQSQGLRKYTGSHIYVVIDEFADLMTICKKQTLPALCRIAQLGRAANIHLILATQRPTRDIINGQIKVNIDARVALRCPTAQDSRNIINIKGAEELPRYGKGYYVTPETMKPEIIDIPYTSDAEIDTIIRHWTVQATGRWAQGSWDYRAN